MSCVNATAGKPIYCRAAVARKTWRPAQKKDYKEAPSQATCDPQAGEPIQIEAVKVAPPKAYEVRIKIICTTVCHSDVTMLTDEKFEFPTIFGHEAIGEVESVGEYVTEFSKRDHVLTNWLAFCGDCLDCKSEDSNLCSTHTFGISSGMQRDPEHSRFEGYDGKRINHFIHVSSFSEYTVMDVSHITKIDVEEIPPSKACLLSCGVPTGLGAAWNVAKIKEGNTVVVFGLGTVGCAVVAAAKQRGAAQIIGVDVKPEKQKLGEQFGITDFVNPDDYKGKSVSEVINARIQNGLGADYCFQCTAGQVEVTREAYACCRKGWGKLIILDGFHLGSELAFPSIDILLKGSIIKGSLYGGYKHRLGVPDLLKRWKNKDYELDGFITSEVDFEDINEAVKKIEDGKGLRCIIWMDKSSKESKEQNHEAPEQGSQATIQEEGNKAESS